MTLKRLGLILASIVALFLCVQALIESWQEPQFQDRLELYQTNIVLQAASWEPSDSNNGNFKAAREAIVGEKPLENATQQYEEARKSTEANLEKAKNKLAELRSESSKTLTTPKPQPEIPPATNASRLQQKHQLQQSVTQLQNSLAELDLQLGILQARQGHKDTASKTWKGLSELSQIDSKFVNSADVLSGIWSDPPRLLPNAEQVVQSNLEGWFRYTTLAQLYQLQQRQEALVSLKAREQEVAEQALLKFAIIGTVPLLGALIGIGLIIFLVWQRFVKGDAALLAQNANVPWLTPWNGETILQVFVLGFFLMGQVVLPLVLSIIPIPRPIGNVRIQALYVLVTYLLVAASALFVLYLSIKRFFPLPENWFRFNFKGNWFLWGLGGYCVALPVVVVVSLINQQLWQGQGGSNPLLQLALSAQDFVALGMFFFTAAIAAPLFEEFLFRGFLLPSLTRYLPVWVSVQASGLLFAVAHLSLSEILPLYALGCVLGVVYTRSRNLLAPMLVHSLWNSGTLLSLFLLGSSK